MPRPMTHCPHCGQSIPEPTAWQDHFNKATCPLCSKALPCRWTTEEWIVKLDRRIDDLEKQVAAMQAQAAEEFC